MRTIACCAVLVLSIAGCEKPNPQQTVPSAPASAAVSAPKAPLSAAPAASSAAPAPGDRWSGEYAAKKAAIELPDKVQDLTWKRDPGDKLVGSGKLSIQVEHGLVTGTASGPLGDQLVSGTLDGKTLHFSLFPKNAAGAEAMTGTGVGEVKGSSVIGTLRCSSPDAVMIRQAAFELKPGK